MNRGAYYEEIKALARTKRDEYSVTTAAIGLALVRDIYRDEGITLTKCPHKLRKVRAAYFIIDGEPHVLVNGRLPIEPRLFAECHELKHHYVDQHLARDGSLACQDVAWDSAPVEEVGAEVFAAEFIFPEAEFRDLLQQLGLAHTGWTISQVVELKRQCPAPVSYQFLTKRLEWFGLIQAGQFAGVQWKVREEQIYGPPLYKRLLARRKASLSSQGLPRRRS